MTLPDNKVADQKAVDKEILAAAKEPLLIAYLKSSFSLKKGQFPHNMKF